MSNLAFIRMHLRVFLDEWTDAAVFHICNQCKFKNDVQIKPPITTEIYRDICKLYDQ